MIYPALVRPLLFRMDAENAHEFVFNRLKKWQHSEAFLEFIRSQLCVKNDRLRVQTSGLTFPNPVGLAAGFDKNGELIPALTACGFGFLEIGSVTAEPSVGNRRPRMFRLPDDRALINRMGLNNKGAAAVAAGLPVKGSRAVPLGINIAKTPNLHTTTEGGIFDYVRSYQALAPLADYTTINISCPNTGDGKSFESPELFLRLLQAIEEVRLPGTPLFVKFSADTPDKDLSKLLVIAEEAGVEGYVAVNTSVKRTGLNTCAEQINRIGAGGLSGRPLSETALNRIAFIRGRTASGKTLISVGGIDSAEEAHQRLRAGADLVQIYTGLVYEGPQLPGKICGGLPGTD
ncbi:MAG: quinone-dependent dihydroorotate dehydrogenase [Candidatus Cyclonatronum sp.]|uniref:quinone-dependent dihydroorotate dehydrogenase n=1 Tax=Cyclonatronum sp. TaxID=3024185 RepID=UPI0025B996F7|nr:quinone-dependent dihydroorotate dehydrogenase [Cyclonatronum sp.]MCC5933377.1 quinone-dependent dihydroorotate dehydrogenase [Balneolales bacterium]MCH8487566.1 quinone-dependent dihydroorotate dehydrogenase [Cyclonatronum sp.]